MSSQNPCFPAPITVRRGGKTGLVSRAYELAGRRWSSPSDREGIQPRVKYKTTGDTTVLVSRITISRARLSKVKI